MCFFEFSIWNYRFLYFARYFSKFEAQIFILCAENRKASEIYYDCSKKSIKKVPSFSIQNLIHSYNSYLARQLSGSARRQRAAEILRQAMDLGNDTRIICANLTRLPQSLKEQLSPEMKIYPEIPEFTIDWFKDVTRKIHVFCQVWLQVVGI